jgi:hypothetical protein
MHIFFFLKFQTLHARSKTKHKAFPEEFQHLGMTGAIMAFEICCYSSIHVLCKKHMAKMIVVLSHEKFLITPKNITRNKLGDNPRGTIYASLLQKIQYRPYLRHAVLCMHAK